MTTLGPRDALVVLGNGSSNWVGWQAANNLVFSTELVPDPIPNCFMWGRFNDVANRTSPSAGGPYGWDTITTERNWQQTGVSPLWGLAKMYSEHYYGSDPQQDGRPRGVYFISYGVSSGRWHQDTGAISAAAAFHPGSENVVDDPGWQTWAEGYLTEALQDLENDPDIDNIYVAGAYLIGGESGSYDPSAAFANDITRFQLAGGMQDFMRGTEEYIGVPIGSLPVVQVKLTRQFNGVASVVDIQHLLDSREQHDLFAARSNNPVTTVDGDEFTVKASDSAHYTSDSFARMGQRLFAARRGLRSSNVLKTRAVATAVTPINVNE